MFKYLLYFLIDTIIISSRKSAGIKVIRINDYNYNCYILITGII